MNILPIRYNFNTSNSNNLVAENRIVLPRYNKTFMQDTVSFGGANLAPFRDGLAINKESERALKDFLYMLKHELKSLIENRKNPEGPIAMGEIGIHGRVKAPYNLLVKANSRDKNKKREIRNIGDIIATRIVLRDSSQKSFDDMFKIFGKLVKQGKLYITEIENYRSSPKKSYISQKTMEQIEESCLKAGLKPKIISEAKDSGYSAVHMNVKLPNGQIAEIQIMGRDVEAFKEIEDLFYKRFCSKPKPLAQEYKVLEKTIDSNIKNMSEFQKETFRHYIADGYDYAKEIPPESTKADYDTNKFLPYPYSLPAELNFAYLYKMKEAADYVAKIM